MAQSRSRGAPSTWDLRIWATLAKVGASTVSSSCFRHSKRPSRSWCVSPDMSHAMSAHPPISSTTDAVSWWPRSRSAASSSGMLKKTSLKTTHWGSGVLGCKMLFTSGTPAASTASLTASTACLAVYRWHTSC